MSKEKSTSSNQSEQKPNTGGQGQSQEGIVKGNTFPTYLAPPPPPPPPSTSSDKSGS